MVFGLNIKGIASPTRCLEGYAFGKQHKNSYPSNVDKMKVVVLGELIHSYLLQAYGSALYHLLFKSDCNAFCFIFFIKHKSKTFECFQAFYKRFQKKENTLRRAFKFDKNKEYVDGTFNKFLEENKIKDEYSVLYAHEQNGFIECDNQIVMEVTKNILHVKGLLKCLWAKATNTIVHVLNKTMSEVLDGLTPFEKGHEVHQTFHIF